MMKNEADLLGDFHLLDTDGSSQNRLQSKKEEMASIEDGDREEIDDSEVDAEDGHEEEQTQQSPFWPVPLPS